MKFFSNTMVGFFFKNLNFQKIEISEKVLLIFFGVEKKSGYNFDSEKAYLSIGEVFRVIPACLHRV